MPDRLDRFSKCPVCKATDFKLKNAVDRHAKTTLLRPHMLLNVAMVMSESLGYRKRTDEAARFLDQFCSIMIDGSDPFFLRLPDFVTQTIYLRGKAMKKKLVGLLKHGKPNSPNVFIMTEEQKPGAN